MENPTNPTGQNSPGGIQGSPQNSSALMNIIMKIASLMPGKGGPGIIPQHTQMLNNFANPDSLNPQGTPVPGQGGNGPITSLPPSMSAPPGGPGGPPPSGMPPPPAGGPPSGGPSPMPGSAPPIPPSTRMAQAPLRTGSPTDKIGGTEMSGRPGVLGPGKGFMKQPNPLMAGKKPSSMKA